VGYNLVEGLRYLYKSTSSSWPFRLGLVAAGLVSLLGCLKLRRDGSGARAEDVLATTAALAVSGGSLAPVLAGGDHFAWGRFFQPLWPLMAVPLWWLVRQVRPQVNAEATRLVQDRSWAAQALFLPLFALLAFANEPSWLNLTKDNIEPEFRLAAEGRRLGSG